MEVDVGHRNAQTAEVPDEALERLDLSVPAGLAQLRLLWALRQGRPWEEHEKAGTVFDLANNADAGRRLLDFRPSVAAIRVEGVPGSRRIDDAPVYVRRRSSIHLQ